MSNYHQVFRNPDKTQHAIAISVTILAYFYHYHLEPQVFETTTYIRSLIPQTLAPHTMPSRFSSFLLNIL